MITIAKTKSEIISYLKQIKKDSNFKLTRVNFSDQNEWIINNGILSHKSGSFFHISAIIDDNGIENLYFFQPQSALTGLLICKKNDKIYVLVQARVEPGNTNLVQIGPTVQSTPANFLRVHGGKATPFLSFFYNGNQKTISFQSSNHLDLGKLYYQKTKWLNYVVIDNLIETPDTFFWCTIEDLADLAKESYFLNTDLRSLISVYNWDRFYQINKIYNSSYGSEILNYLLSKSFISQNSKFIPFNDSKNISVSNHKIHNKKDDDYEIGIYHVETNHREVKKWHQPLWSAKKRGLVQLFFKVENGIKKYLLEVKKESGIYHNYSVSSSQLFYPNEDIPKNNDKIGETVYSFFQSDEGGRFINHEYLFRIAKVKEPFDTNENQFWVTIEELKSILRMSNTPNIQLRNICSLLINELNKIN